MQLPICSSVCCSVRAADGSGCTAKNDLMSSRAPASQKVFTERTRYGSPPTIAIFGERPEEADHRGAKRASIVAVGRHRREADLVEERFEERSDEHLEARLRRRVREIVVHEAETTTDLREDAGRVLSPVAGGER